MDTGFRHTATLLQCGRETVRDYCGGAGCRDRKILNYFGQDLDKQNCRACDICLGEIEGVPDALTVAQKILSSIIRRGSASARITPPAS